MNKKLISLARQESSEGKLLPDKQMKEIISLYSKKLILPRKLKQQIILCPVGLIGSGKTTILKILSKKLGLLRISTDELRKLFIERGYNFLRTKEAVSVIIKKYLKSGYSLALDADHIDPLNIKKLRELNKVINAKLIFIHINPPERFIIENLKMNRRISHFKDSTEAINNYKRRKPIHKEFLSKISFFFTFDTSKENMKDQINNFIFKVKENFLIK